ncbi:MAG: 2-amino-4-hydroxy-6-hydroxymethyldihydropteridine diphosphokinase [Candidatus Omnitrophica bacterium]|nr:2-amino-4-hydroxy-6-hydroxymethyldihydropteridine diphosphokinase [Candidatus Omnitrophota bacterium]
MSCAFIGIGSNEGDRLDLISRAIGKIASHPQVQVVAIAPIIETDPLPGPPPEITPHQDSSDEITKKAGPGPPQGPYLNTVIQTEVTLQPLDLLGYLQGIERALGRLPSKQRWGPRPIDLDILLYEDRIIHEPNLEVPHPRLHERFFVLQPLAQLAPSVVHPLMKETVASLLSRL